jgi:hypothetical protein
MKNIDGLTLILSSAILLSPYILKYVKRLTPSIIGGIVTSLGLLGTFIGIFLGLLNFDVTNLSDSVPQLLDGLKTAFLTSIAGLISSLIIKSFPVIYGMRKGKEENAASPTDYLSKIAESAKLIVSLLDMTVPAISRIERSISGDGETTLVTQIQKLRIDTTDGFKTLNSSFDDFAEKMVKDNTQAIIEALEKVMRDFNVLITEQIGDNFKHLNEGVGRMLEWQKEYSERIEKMTDQFQQTLEGMEQCEATLGDIAHKTGAIMDDLGNISGGLYISLDSIRKVGQDAQTVLPDIERAIKTLTVDFSKTVSDASGIIRLTVEQQKKEQIQLVANMNKHIDDFLHKLDEALGDGLNNSLNLLGSKLAALSGKFVADYTPLTEKLRSIIRITENINTSNHQNNLWQ